jgi:creatinine amidohydrolase/Fe(II)-dependent formamide hydrolase-like protein
MRLASDGVHQESVGAEHMTYLLLERGLLPAGSKLRPRLKPRPEVMKLRFDRERSPIDGIPVDLRAGLYQIFLDHSQGAVRRSGRIWMPTRPLEDPRLYRPYRHEAPAPRRQPRTIPGPVDTSRRGYFLGELSWPEAERRLSEVDIALLPVGALEQHGPHLPLDTDAFDAHYLCRRVAESCSEPKPIVLPLIPYGVSFHHDDFPGTISVGQESLSKMAYDVGMSCARNGITKFIIVNGHGGNAPALQLAAQMISRDARIFTCVETGETSNVDVTELCETNNDVHAGEIETSTSLATRPHLVQMKAAERLVPDFSSRYLNFTAKRSVEWYARTARISATGVLGDPTRASRDKGEQMWKVMVRNLMELVEELKGLTLEEIYERRY